MPRAEGVPGSQVARITTPRAEAAVRPRHVVVQARFGPAKHATALQGKRKNINIMKGFKKQNKIEVHLVPWEGRFPEHDGKLPRGREPVWGEFFHDVVLQRPDGVVFDVGVGAVNKQAHL